MYLEGIFGKTLEELVDNTPEYALFVLVSDELKVAKVVTSKIILRSLQDLVDEIRMKSGEEIVYSNLGKFKLKLQETWNKEDIPMDDIGLFLKIKQTELINMYRHMKKYEVLNKKVGFRYKAILKMRHYVSGSIVHCVEIDQAGTHKPNRVVGVFKKYKDAEEFLKNNYPVKKMGDTEYCYEPLKRADNDLTNELYRIYKDGVVQVDRDDISLA